MRKFRARIDGYTPTVLALLSAAATAAHAGISIYQFLWSEVIRAWENDNQVCGHPPHTSARPRCSVSLIRTFYIRMINSWKVFFPSFSKLLNLSMKRQLRIVCESLCLVMHVFLYIYFLRAFPAHTHKHTLTQTHTRNQTPAVYCCVQTQSFQWCCCDKVFMTIIFIIYKRGG